MILSSIVYRGVHLNQAIRCRKGFGVHSPFVFDLITKVIGEDECAYYSYDDIELLRKQLSLQAEYKHAAIRPKLGALLFRLANHFKPKNILQIGTRTGLSTLYLTLYASHLRCITLEEDPAFEPIAKQGFAKLAHDPIDMRVGGYSESLPRALKDMSKVDFLFINTLPGTYDDKALLLACLEHLHKDSVLVLMGIQSDKRMHALWEELVASPSVTVSLDLFVMGIVLFNKGLHKKNYLVYF